MVQKKTIIVISVVMTMAVLAPIYLHYAFPPKPYTEMTNDVNSTKKLEQEIHSMVNIQRQENGLTPISFDVTLSDIARNHSIDMANRHYISHYTQGPNYVKGTEFEIIDTPCISKINSTSCVEGKDPAQRIFMSGYSCHKDQGNGNFEEGIAENISLNNWDHSIEDLANSTVSDWMRNKIDRTNILTSSFDREGIGVAISDDNRIIITDDIC